MAACHKIKGGFMLCWRMVKGGMSKAGMGSGSLREGHRLALCQSGAITPESSDFAACDVFTFCSHFWGLKRLARGLGA